MKIKICLIDNTNNETDFITADIPTWSKFDVISLLVNNLFLLVRRNVKIHSLPEYLSKQMTEFILN